MMRVNSIPRKLKLALHCGADPTQAKDRVTSILLRFIMRKLIHKPLIATLTLALATAAVEATMTLKVPATTVRASATTFNAPATPHTPPLNVPVVYYTLPNGLKVVIS